ncbi:MAG: peptidase [Flavobacteriaceae bacterium]|nr:peptidase [Flavobacteriaceae bacterium]
MKKATYLFLFFLITSNVIFSQSIDDSFSQKKMIKDLKIFKNIRLKANSGLYKYRTEKEIDSIYNWAKEEIKKSSTYREFYNIICQLTDFEGSLHNETYLPENMSESLKNEKEGYFPLPIKWINRKWIINYSKGAIPLGAEIISINNDKIDSIILNLYKYYTTDGVNTTGKRIGLEVYFSKYYRLNFGKINQFIVEYKTRNSDETKKIILNSIANKEYYKNVRNRYSKPFDEVNYTDWQENEIYNYKHIDKETGVLTLNSFSMGNEKDPMHLKYVSFLDSIFISIKERNIKNLIVDVRYNGGGDDPNDIVTYSYLTNRNFSENKKAWISYYKIPYLKYIDTKVPSILRPFGVGKYNRLFQKVFPKEENGRFYQNSKSSDHKVRTPNKNTFNGNIYLLISPGVASAGSLFAAMVAGNKNTIVIGEETMGGYYGHNGHRGLDYILPKSKFGISFSVVNLEQDVPKKANQIYNRGIIPDYNVIQNFDDYLNQKDTQMNFTIDLIKKNMMK